MTASPPRPDGSGSPRRSRGSRRPWLPRQPRQILAAGLVCFGLWTLLDASALQRSALVSPLGTRRSVALAILDPLARLSAIVGLDTPVRLADAALGRAAPGALTGPVTAPVASTPSAPSTGPSPAESPPGSPTPTAAPPGPPPATPPPPPTLPPLQVPSAARPLRVLVVGDSIGRDMGVALAGMLDATGVVNVVVDGRPATGLARPDYFDWPAQLAADVAHDQPNIVVAMFGGNDAQPFLVNGQPVQVGTPAWRTAYGARVAAAMAAATSRGARLCWVGMPIMASPSFSTLMRTLDQIYRAEADGRPGTAYLSSWSVFTTGSGGYSAYLPDRSGTEQLVRQADGVHFTVAGADRLASAVIAAMRQAWQLHLPPTD